VLFFTKRIDVKPTVNTTCFAYECTDYASYKALFIMWNKQGYAKFEHIPESCVKKIFPRSQNWPK
jgi:hypothetical protein